MLSLFKIKNDVKEQWGINIDIIITTKITGDVNGFAKLDNTIVINGNKFISDDKILSVIAHELSHILSGVSDHDKLFSKSLIEVIAFFKEKYNVDIAQDLDDVELKGV